MFATLTFVKFILDQVLGLLRLGLARLVEQVRDLPAHVSFKAAHLEQELTELVGRLLSFKLVNDVSTHTSKNLKLLRHLDNSLVQA